MSLNPDQKTRGPQRSYWGRGWGWMFEHEFIAAFERAYQDYARREPIKVRHQRAQEAFNNATRFRSPYPELKHEKGQG